MEATRGAMQRRARGIERRRGGVLAAVAAALLAAVAVPAWASEGVIEISQTCALTGCFPGDDPGFPVTLVASGSYRLTSDLDLSVAPDPPNTTAIEAATEDITLDLAGFTIRGMTSCFLSENSPGGVSCTGSATQGGVGYGINGAGRMHIRNGVVRGMGAHGIFCSRCTVEGVVVQDVPGTGIVVYSGVIKDSIVAEVAEGIRAYTGSIIERCSAVAGEYGVHVVDGSVVRSATAGFATVAGIFAEEGSSVESSSVGMPAPGYQAHGVGIKLLASRASGNVVRAANGLGIEADATSAWGGNLLVDNNSAGVQATGGVQIATNVCGNAVCP